MVSLALCVGGEVIAVGFTHNILVILLGSERSPMSFFPSFRGASERTTGRGIQGELQEGLKVGVKGRLVMEPCPVGAW